MLAEGETEEAFMPLERVPLTRDGAVTFHVENTLCAIAAALALNVPADVIRARAETFSADLDKVPARFNVLEIQGATVIVDYGHNVDALAALIPVMDKLPHQRRACVYSAAGDRRDCDLVRQGEILGNSFDQVVLYEDHYLRGRAEGEIIRLFRGGVDKGARAKQIDEVRGADAAVEFALRRAQPGDLILVQADTVDETLAFIRRYVESIAPEPTMDGPIAPSAAEGEPSAVPMVAK
jgi:cyanophycin synthetase